MLTKLYSTVQVWKGSDEGATALEYGLLVALIALAIVVAVGLFGDALAGFFNGIAGKAGLL